MNDTEIMVSQLKMGTINGVRQPNGTTHIRLYLPVALLKKIQSRMKDDDTRSSTINRLILLGLEHEHNEQHR